MNELVLSQVVKIEREGVLLRGGSGDAYVSFAECARNFQVEQGGDGRCVAERDASRMTFLFYSRPRARLELGGRFWRDLLRGGSAVREFRALQAAIERFGYKSCDMT